MGLAFGFDMFSIMFTIVFLLTIGIFIVTAIRGITHWHKNNHSPRLTVLTTVISKRSSVSHHTHHQADGHHHHHTSTTYYVTFQVESGDRMEFCVSGYEYGMLAEGDVGRLTFQGTRYLSFERQ